MLWNLSDKFTRKKLYIYEIRTTKKIYYKMKCINVKEKVIFIRLEPQNKKKQKVYLRLKSKIYEQKLVNLQKDH